MAVPRMTWNLAFVLFLATTASAQYQIVCSGEAAGGYAAFPDICRLQNGDLYCVFYSGYGHVSTPNSSSAPHIPSLAPHLCGNYPMAR